MSVFSTVMNFLTYKGPKKYDPFELLEDETEDEINDSTPDAKKAENGNSKETNGSNHPKMRKQRRIVYIGRQNKDTKSTVKLISGQEQESGNNQDLAGKLEFIKKDLNYPNNQDIIVRNLTILRQKNAFIVYLNGMADKTLINDYVLRQLMMNCNANEKAEITIDYILNNLLSINQATKETEHEKITNQILQGFTALFIDQCEECILIETQGFEKRAVSTPITEGAVRGSQEAFVENLRTNITLVRKLIKNKELVTEIMDIGNTNHNTCAIMHIKGISNPKIVQEVKKRIRSINVDFVLGNGALEQLIEDHPFSLFPQIMNTERPDRTASFLMDGMVAVICDGTPFALALPITFYHLFHTPEDSALRWQFGTFLRIVRLIAFYIALFLPGAFLALILYHQEMIPTELLSTFANAKENIPFPTVVELLIMEVFFEIVREASVRVPSAIGQTLGVVGAVILGQAAVFAGIVSPALIIVVAITGLSSYTIPNYSLSFGVRILRFVFLLLGATAGFYGLIAGLFVVSGYACSKKSFGVPYFSPVAPVSKTSHNTVARVPIWLQNERPDYLNTRNRKKSGSEMRGWVKQKQKDSEP